MKNHLVIFTSLLILLCVGCVHENKKGANNPDNPVELTWFQDLDSDSFGNPAVSVLSVDAPAQFVAATGDCDDNDASINPGAVEIPNNGIDEDCNGSDLVETNPIVRVSVDSAGTEASLDSARPSVSADGRYVAFDSGSNNLIAGGDNNAASDIFVRDTQTGTTIRVSVDSLGAVGDDNSFAPSFSADGRFVAFESDATLVAGDNNNARDIFVRDTQSGTTIRVSVDSLGTGGNNDSVNAFISADGRYVAFDSVATNLVVGDGNGTRDVFVHDTQTGTTTRVSVDALGASGDSISNFPSVSADGRYVAFSSLAGNLVAGDTNGLRDIFVRDTQSGTTIRVSVDSAGAEANDASANAFISTDGRYVAFDSDASNLVAGDTNVVNDIFVRDIQSGITTRVSVDSASVESNGNSFLPSISTDGRYVAFESDATNLVVGDTNGLRDIFIHDTQSGATARVSVDSMGVEGNGISRNLSLSADGQYVAFESFADNLVAGDTNGAQDVFLAPNPFF